MDEGRTRELHLGRPLHLGRTLGPLRQGRRDTTHRIDGATAWRASRTPDGPSTLQLRVVDDRLRARAWGPGADWALDHVEDLVGEDDEGATVLAGMLRPGHPADEVVRGLLRRQPGLRITRSRAVLEALVPIVLAQKVTGLEAKRSHRDLMAEIGETAPGPGVTLGLRVPPSPATLAATPSWVWHRWGVERKRADIIRHAGARHRRLEEAADLSPVDARRRLRALPGVGAWTAAEVALIALGDADAVSVGDYHLPNQVSWALAGEPRGDDRRMLELLEPYRGQRGRVLRLLVSGGLMAPRYGPRTTITSFRNR